MMPAIAVLDGGITIAFDATGGSHYVGVTSG